MKQSEQTNELAAALAKAQAEIKSARKDVDNNFFHTKYADLDSVWNACRDQLSKNGLSIIQRPYDTEGGRVGVETTLLHSSGQFYSSSFSSRLQKDDAQGIGSAITYLRRYGLSAMVGIAPTGDDDDGNGASGKTAEPKPPQKPAAKPLPPKVGLDIMNDHDFPKMVQSAIAEAGLTVSKAELTNTLGVADFGLKALDANERKKNFWNFGIP